MPMHGRRRRHRHRSNPRRHRISFVHIACGRRSNVLFYKNKFFFLHYEIRMETGNARLRACLLCTIVHYTNLSIQADNMQLYFLLEFFFIFFFTPKCCLVSK